MHWLLTLCPHLLGTAPGKLSFTEDARCVICDASLSFAVLYYYYYQLSPSRFHYSAVRARSDGFAGHA